ncbi:hypothetical protein SAMN06264364_102180 [Quadrisphaera granulorum]|uniref:WXG100 family type VII secretion target n=1 Tax=Quadrisphaera granulorum TaxID=317664 RepID=A0A316AFX7_9ACTN|nr:hypothetical protein BXY45_102180 [Quadrisphaera granulorum]SZE95311.1 hypothetical protein SAMN06264364_102180 [Quadrisphaera granulorum]
MPNLSGHVPNLGGVRASLAAGDDLAQLAARLHGAAEAVRGQETVHRELLALDWQGSAASTFRFVVAGRVERLVRLAGELDELAHSAEWRAAAGQALRAAEGWPQ